MCCFVLNVTFSICFIDKRYQPLNLIEIRNVAINEDKIAAEPHHLAYLLSHVRTVAMDGAFVTLGLLPLYSSHRRIWPVLVVNLRVL